jgi:hypothetical protein
MTPRSGGAAAVKPSISRPAKVSRSGQLRRFDARIEPLTQPLLTEFHCNAL